MAEKAVVKESFFKKWGTVFVLSLALAIIIIDTTLLNVSLSTIIRDLNTDIQSIQWVITAYSLTIASLMITGGRLGDLFGRKKMFIVGAVIFAAGSFIASISANVPTMIAGESIIEGIGAALMMPATASLLVSRYKGRDRSIAFGIWGGVAAASTAIGPLLGGFFTTYYSWRWGFRINIVVALLLILGSKVIKEYRDTDEAPSLDWVGVLLSATGMLATVYGIIESSTYGWWKAKVEYSVFGHAYHLAGYSITPFAIGLGIILLALFVIWEGHRDKTGRTPLVSLKLFKNRQFMAGVGTTSILSLGQAGLIFSIPVFMQAVRGENAFQTGLALLPLSITALIMAPLGGFFSHKIAPKRLVQVGLFSSFLGYVVLGQTFRVDATPADFIPALILMGAGIGLTMASISNLTLSAVSPKQSGEASGVNNTMRQVGGTLGTAIIGAVLISAISANLIKGINDSKEIPAALKPLITDKISSQTSNVEFEGGAKLPASVPEAVGKNIGTIGKQAITDANKEAIKYASVFAFIGFLAAFSLPGGKNIEAEEDIAVRPKK
ncbi:MAG: MFS transporter [bacterium]|nr:MFS transporter [bacterium]